MPKQPRSLARHEAWTEFAKRADIGHFNAPIRMSMEAAFNAGWAARKAAQYAAIGQRQEPRKLVENLTVHERQLREYASCRIIENKS